MYLDELQEELSRAEALIRKLETRIAQAPAAKLYACKEHGRYRYYHKIENSSKRIYLSCDKLPYVKQLAQKEYDKRALELLEKHTQNLRNALEALSKDSLEELYEGLPESKKPYVKPIWLSNEQYAAYWVREAYEPLLIDAENAFVTNKGHLVRSKSEVIIANSLYDAGIAYRYECPFTFDDGVTVYPDFTVLNARTRQVYLWEHFGMMDDLSYRNNAFRKIEAYEKNTQRYGMRFLATFESGSHPFDIAIIRHYIQNRFL